MAAKQPSVEEFLANLEHSRRADIEVVRSALLASDPTLAERVKWNAPSFGHDGDDRVTFRLQPKNRCELILHRGAKVRTDPFSFDDPEGLIVWASSDRGVLSVPEAVAGDDLDRLLQIVTRWLAATRDATTGAKTA